MTLLPFALTLFLLAGSLGVAAQEREVDGNVITSSATPAARLVLDDALVYVGGQNIMLNSTTQAEQHIYVEADGKRIRRLYWIQFEGRLNGGRPYDYSADPVVDLAGKSFHTNFRFYPPSGFAGPAGSDGDQARQLIESKGYELGPDLARVRLVWLLGEPPLDELMIIYVEDLEPHGLTVSALDADDARWQSFKEGLRDRAARGLQVLPLDD
jgi:hypothetical protein